MPINIRFDSFTPVLLPITHIPDDIPISFYPFIVYTLYFQCVARVVLHGLSKRLLLFFGFVFCAVQLDWNITAVCAIWLEYVLF